MNDGRPILLVEDDADIREVVELVLSSHGYEVTTLADGEQAVARLEQGPRPALVLLDLMLPRISGEDVLKAIRGQPSLADVPVVIVSGDSDAQQRVRALAAEGLLRKPVELDELLEVVARFVGSA